MAATAPGFGPVTAERRAFAAALQSQERAATARVWLARKTASARAMLAGALNWLRGTAAFRWVSGLFSWIGRQLATAASMLGRRGMLAIGLTVLTSEKGQAALGAIAEKVVNTAKWVVDTAVDIVSWPFRKIPFLAGIGNGMVKGKETLYRWFREAWGSALVQTPLAWLKHDKPLATAIQTVSRPVAIYFMISRFVPGWWKVLAWALAIPFLLPKSSRDLVKKQAGEYLSVVKTEEPWAEATVTDMNDHKSKAEVKKEKASTAQQDGKGPEPTTAPAGPVWRDDQQAAAQKIAEQVFNTVITTDWQNGPEKAKREAIITFTTDDFRNLGPQGKALNQTQHKFATELLKHFKANTGPFEQRLNMSDEDANAAMLLALKELALQSVLATRNV